MVMALDWQICIAKEVKYKRAGFKVSITGVPLRIWVVTTSRRNTLQARKSAGIGLKSGLPVSQ
jgi:hypothetical protein